MNRFRNRRSAVILWIGFGFLVFLQPLGAEGKLLFEIVAAEGMCFTEYHSAPLELEPHEFPEFNHELGVNAYLFHRRDWFGIGASLGCIYNLTGASSAYLEDPTLKYMLHWIKVPLLLSLAVIRDSSVMHLDLGLYGSLFLTGQKLWKDEGSGVEETTRLTGGEISPDFGLRAQLVIDMGMLRIRRPAVELGAGLGLVVEKSLTDISRDPSESMTSFRLAACLLLPITRR